MAASIGTVAIPSTMKWYVAVAVGLPVVVGVGYWFLTRKNRKSKDIACGNRNIETKKKSVKSDVSDKVDEKHEKKTPVEEAKVLKEKGNKCFKNGMYEEAIKYYREAIEICPETETMSLATFYQNIAAAYEQLGKYEEVKKACNEALSLNPGYVKALFRRANAYEQTKELALAFEDLTTVCFLENFLSQSTLIAADTILTKLVKQNVKEAMEKRVPTLPSNYFITTYFSTFVTDPIHSFTSQTEGDFSKGFLKAVDCIRKEDYEYVVSACTDEILEDKALYKNEALLLRGTFYLFSGNYAGARSDLGKIINNEKIDPKLKVNALIKHACIHIQLEEHAQGFEDFEKAIKIDPNNSDIYYHRGQINLMTEKLEEAAEDFQKASSLQPNNSAAAVQKCYTDYRCALLSKGVNKVEPIFERFEQLIQDYPQCGECYSLYAQVLCNGADYEKSEILYDKALQVDPKNANLLVSKAVLGLKKNADVDYAIQLLNKALELDEKCAFGYETWGNLELQRGNLKRGIELLEKAISLANSGIEMSHYFSLKNAAEAQKKTFEKLDMHIIENIMD